MQTATQAISQDIRSMLRYLAVDNFMIDILIPFVWFVPGAVDPDSPSIIELNKAIQRGLRAAGFRDVRVNGILDRTTAAALDQVATTPSTPWMSKSFVAILGDVIKAARNPSVRAKAALAGYFEYEGAAPGPLPGSMVGTPPGPLGMGAFSFDSGVPLTFGQGIVDKSNIVPIPKSFGPTANAFKNLQRQINRLLSVKGSRIAEDGIIGSGTFAAFKKVRGQASGIPAVDNTLELAKRALSIGNKLKAAADGIGVSTSANKGATSTKASVAEPEPPPMTPQQAKSFGAGAAAKKYLPFLAFAGAIAVAVSMKRKGKGKGKKGKKK